MGGKGKECWRQKYVLSSAAFGIITLFIFEMIVNKLKLGKEASYSLSGSTQIQKILEMHT